jgi:hypothetical protein
MFFAAPAQSKKFDAASVVSATPVTLAPSRLFKNPKLEMEEK